MVSLCPFSCSFFGCMPCNINLVDPTLGYLEMHCSKVCIQLHFLSPTQLLTWTERNWRWQNWIHFDFSSPLSFLSSSHLFIPLSLLSLFLSLSIHFSFSLSLSPSPLTQTEIRYPTESKIWCSMRKTVIFIIVTHLAVIVSCIPVYLSYTIHKSVAENGEIYYRVSDAATLSWSASLFCFFFPLRPYFLTPFRPHFFLWNTNRIEFLFYDAFRYSSVEKSIQSTFSLRCKTKFFTFPPSPCILFSRKDAMRMRWTNWIFLLFNWKSIFEKFIYLFSYLFVRSNFSLTLFVESEKKIETREKHLSLRSSPQNNWPTICHDAAQVKLLLNKLLI